MVANEEELLAVVNASGFPFQIRVEQEIIDKSSKSGWRIAAREHRWLDAHDGSERFVDLILRKNIHRTVVECKRVIDAKWVFLIPDGTPEAYSMARMRWTAMGPEYPTAAGWYEFSVRPGGSDSGLLYRSRAGGEGCANAGTNCISSYEIG